MNIPKDLLYTKDHEWVRLEGEIATIGVTEFAAGELGDVVFVQLPKIGQNAKQGDSLGSIEAVKAVADIFSPVSGSVTEINPALSDKPEMMNQDPYGKGWVAKIRVSNFAAEKSQLVDPAAYKALTSA